MQFLLAGHLDLDHFESMNKKILIPNILPSGSYVILSKQNECSQQEGVRYQYGEY